jgi:hypothetical protein
MTIPIVDEIKKQVGMAALCDQWNGMYPFGAYVRYWRGERIGEPSGEGKTRTPAQVRSGHTPVIWIEGCRGYIALSHIEVIEVITEPRATVRVEA